MTRRLPSWGTFINIVRRKDRLVIFFLILLLILMKIYLIHLTE